jgi:hypothetical protein
MNKAITDGLVLMPTPFAAGLGVWSSGDGVPGSNTYAGSGGGVFVPADQDFAGCMEIVKGAATQKVRYMGETPILPGCYLRVTARVKAVAGALPSVRIAGWPGGTGGNFVSGKVMVGPSKPLTAYGEVVEVSAIIGSGQRGGVDMVWDGAVIYGHLGLDFTGANGGVVRIDDIVIEDVTTVFIRNMLAQVDVRDYGAKGNGTTNDLAAFNAADAAANGREVLVPAGTYLVDGNMTFNSRVRFEGTVVSPPGRLFILQKNYDFGTYVEAFKNEEMAFIKAFGALLNFSDHEGLDLQGRRIGLSAPVDMQAADPTKLTFNTRRVIRNGQFQPIDGAAWNDTVVTSPGTYSASNPLTLTNVTNIANIPVGSLITGNGVGREVYVREVNIAQQRLTLSAGLYDPGTTQTYTFRRFKYLLDFSGFDDLGKFIVDQVEFQCNGTASGVMLSRQGITNQFSDCFFTKPKDRGISSVGSGCQGLMIDRCTFASNEQPLDAESRSTVGMNANANDVKIRDSLAFMFRHFAVLGGSGSVITGNHWFQGDETTNGVRKGGLVITTVDPKSVITGNYIDNNFIEWTNEHDATPAQGGDFSFGGLTITGNIFTANDVANWFNWIVLKPYGAGHSIDGFAVVGNVFRALNGAITRVERVDTTFADLNYGLIKNVTFSGNTFNGVSEEIRNPAPLLYTQSTLDRIWVVESEPWLPFKGRARTVESVTPVGRIERSGGQAIYESPYVEVEQGNDQRQVRVIFDTPCTGKVRVVVRMDNPL